MDEPAQMLATAASECTAFLARNAFSDWSTHVPDLDWTIAKVVGHVAEGLMWYACDLAAGLPELSTETFDIKVESEPAELVRTVATMARLLTGVLGNSPAGSLGYHPMGDADASGFAAMGCDELLIHTDDVARALGVTFEPTPEIAGWTLRRLFPWVSADLDPWEGLRWANGRIATEGRERLGTWVWHCAPLPESEKADPSS
jgi:uncharacterized protein (TIGR03083 family)